MASQPTWITPAGDQGTYPEGQLLTIQFTAIPSDQSQGRVANILLGQIDTVSITNSGSGYITDPAVTVTNAVGDTVGSGAAFISSIDKTTGKVSNLIISSYGNNYLLPPIVTIAPPTAGSITSITLGSAGSGYSKNPLVTFTATSGANATAVTNITASIAALTVANTGSNYEIAPALNITGGNNKTKASAVAVLNAVVDYIEVLVSSQYATVPDVVIAGGGGQGASAQAVLDDLGYLTAIIVTAAGSNYTSEPPIIVDGQDGIARAHISGTISGFTLTSQGTDYTSAPTVLITGGGGSGASAAVQSADVQNGAVTAITGISTGSNYVEPPFVTFSGGGVPTATGNVSIRGSVSKISVTGLGTGYTQANTTVTVTGSSGTGATADPVINAAGELVDVVILSAGINYTSAPTVTIVTTDAGATGATARAKISGVLNNATVTNAGSGYTRDPDITVVGGFGQSGRVTPVLNGSVTSIDVITPGTGYLSSPLPTVNIVRAVGDTTGIGATATAVVTSVTATAVLTTNRGQGYTTVPAVTITPSPSDSTGSGATAVASISSNAVSDIQLITRGTGYTVPPTVTVEAPVQQTKLTANAVTASTMIELNNTTNLGPGMTAVINGLNYKIASVSSPNIIIDTAVTVSAGTLIYFNGLTAKPVATIESTPVVYNLQSGSLPEGITSNPIRLTTDGRLIGIPKEVAVTTISEFTIRATDIDGNIRDRVFSIGIQGPDVPIFLTNEGIILNIIDSTWTSFQVLYITPDPVDVVITVDSGSLPSGLTIDTNGLITGYATPPVDSFGQPITSTYNFTLRATKVNTTQSSTREFSIIVKNQDEEISTLRVPAILNNNPLTPTHTTADPYFDFYFSGTDLGTYRHDNYFAYKIIGYDFDYNGGGIQNSAVKKIIVTYAGSGYSIAPNVSIVRAPGDITGRGATAVAAVNGGSITGITVTNSGTAYTLPPLVVISPPASGGTDFATAVTSLASITVTSGGSGYLTAPAVTISAPDFINGSPASATAVISNGVVTDIITTNSGLGYTAVPTITIAAPAPILKTVTPAVVSSNTITLSETDNLVVGMTVTISSVVHTVTTVNTGVSVVVDGAAVSIANNTSLVFTGQTAVATLIQGGQSALTIQYSLDGLSNINKAGPAINDGLSFDIYTGWITGYLPEIGSQKLTFQLSAYVYKGPLISTTYNYNITIQGAVSTEISWLDQNLLLGTLYNGEISYLSVAASNASSDLQYRLAPLITKNLNAITWGAITKTATTQSDTTGAASVYVSINVTEITNISIGATVSGGGITSPYPVVVEIQASQNPPRIRLSSAQAITLGAQLTFTTNAYVTVGDSGVIQYALVTQNSWYPANTATASDYSTLADFNGVTWLPSFQQFVAVGDLSGTPVLFTSDNAIDWFQSSQPFNFGFTDITVGTPLVGSTPTATIVTVAKSGRVFRGINSNLLVDYASGTTADLTAVTWDDYNGQFILVAENGYIATSPDGIVWNSQTVRFPTTYGQPPSTVPVRYSKTVSTAVSSSNVITLTNTTSLSAGMLVTISNIVRTISTVSAGVSVTVDGPPATLASGTVLVFSPAVTYTTPYSFSLNAVSASPTSAVYSVDITAAGSNYTRVPSVNFSGGGGSGATAVAVLGSGPTAGQVVSIVVVSAGSGYTSTPSVQIVPAVGDTTGGGAAASAVTIAALVAVGSVRYSFSASSTSLLVVSKDGGNTWLAQPVFNVGANQPVSITNLTPLQNIFYSITYNPTKTDYWLIGSTNGTVVEGTHTGTTDIGGTGDAQNNIPPAAVQGAWTTYDIDVPYTINDLWAAPVSGTIVDTPNILSCGTVGIVQESTTGEDASTWSSINVQSLPRSLTLLPSGDISGRVAFVPNDVELPVGSKTRYEFVVQAYSTSNRDISTTRDFAIDVVKLWDQPFETLYIKALPSQQDRSIISSLVNAGENIYPVNSVYRPDDPYYGISQNVVYQHEFGVYASSLEEYINAEQKNHYWRNIVLGQLQVARALDNNGNPLYEVVYSLIQDNLVNPQGKSASLQIEWPEPINLNLGSWYDSLTYQYDSYVYAVPAQLKTTSGCTNNVVIPLNSTTGIQLGMVMSGTSVTNADGSVQRSGRVNGAGEPSVIAVNEYSVTVDKAQTLPPGAPLRFSIPTYYTARTPGSAQTLYPDSLPNMRYRIQENLGRNTSDTILPRWMTSQQTNGNTLGYVPAWVICYVKPGFGETVKNNIQNNWPYELNQIDFRLDRFEVDKSATYNWDNNLVPPNWDVLPSAGVTSITNESKDFYVLFPQKTILPK